MTIMYIKVKHKVYHQTYIKKIKKITFSHSVALHYFNDLKSSIIKSKLKLIAISLSI